VQQITDAAGVNKAMLYYYFGSKEGLYDQLIGEGIAGMESAVKAAEGEEGGIIQQLGLFLTTYLGLVAEKPELARLIYREIVGAGERDRRIVADHFSGSIERLSKLLEDAQAAGHIRQVDALLSAYTLVGMANIFISRFFLTGRPLEVPLVVQHILDLFMQGAAV
jgi:TetR/AcrR family transcriptional regulator